MGVSGRHAPATLLVGKTRYQLSRRLVGAQGRSGWAQNILPPPGFDPQTVQPVVSYYTDYAIPACFLIWSLEVGFPWCPSGFVWMGLLSSSCAVMLSTVLFYTSVCQCVDWVILAAVPSILPLQCMIGFQLYIPNVLINVVLCLILYPQILSHWSV